MVVVLLSRYSVLMTVDVDAMVTAPLPKSALALLLRLINFFVVVPEQYRHLQATKEAGAGMDYSALVRVCVRARV